MQYKKILRNRALRLHILKVLGWVPDSVMLRLQYRLHMGRRLHLRNPKRFTEKIQLYKMRYRRPEMGVMADKYRVREYLERRGYGHLLPGLYGVYRRGEEIDFAALPQRFVIKTNDGAGGNNIIICKDKSQLDIEKTVKRVNSWLNVKSVNAGREWAYTQIPESLIIVEEYLENTERPDAGLEDYKFFCFDGRVHAIQHDTGRFGHHLKNFYDRDWNQIEVKCTLCDNFDTPAERPARFEEMVKIAEQLAKGYPSIRVDLYAVGNKIYFGEFTFYSYSGYIQFDPDEFDYRLGSLFHFPEKQ